MVSPLYPMPTPSWLRPQVSSNPLAAFLGDPRQFLRDNSSLLIGLGAGIAGGGPDFGQAVSAGLSGAGQGAQIDTQRNQTQAQENQTRAWLQANYPQYANLPVDQGWAAAMKDMTGSAQSQPASVQEYQFYADQEKAAGRDPQSYADWRTGSNQTKRAGLGQPVPLKNRKTGEYVPFEPMSDGSMINTLTGEPANATDWLYDPGMINSDRAAGTAYGTAQGGAQFNLPAAKQNIDLELANIDAIANDQAGLDQTFGNLGGFNVGGIGIPNQWTPMLPNTPRANLKARIDQVVGQNFLQAYASLKGAGAITETEGAKAQEAMARLSGAQSKESFLQALSDLKQVLKIGYDRMTQQASGGPYQSSGFTPAPLGNGATTDDLVTKYLGQ